jgi:hypothetical protein
MLALLRTIVLMGASSLLLEFSGVAVKSRLFLLHYLCYDDRTWGNDAAFFGCF